MKAGWIKTTLGDAFITSTGSTPPKSNSDFYGHFMPLVKPPELCDSTLDSAEDGLSESGAQVARTLPLNSILVSCIGNLGKIGMNKVPVAFNQQINAIHPAPGKALPEFMFFQTLGGRFREQLEAMASGTTVPIVNKSKFNRIEIVLPPLPEQQRIVNLLDESFEGIATAKANAEKNQQNARAIFESHLQLVFTQCGQGWSKWKLKEVCDKITDGTHQTPTYFDEGIVFLSSRNVTSGKIDWDKIKYIDEVQHLQMHKRVAPRMGDILLAKNGTTGVAAMVDRDVVCDIYVSLALLRAREEILPDLLLYFVNSPVAKAQFNKRLKGTGVPNLHLEEIREVEISFPTSKAEQRGLLQSLDGVASVTRRLEAIYQQKLTVLDELKRSLLQLAFSGQL